MTMLRLAQEALLNVQQHAHAHSALITLRYDPRQLTLTIQDDGVGLLDGTHERPGVHALRAIGYRLAEIDGTLEVSEGESGGVTVRATAPFC
jgi:signal transduction histidine kinase